MLFEAAGYSCVGTTRDSNQDSFAIKVATTELGDVALVAVADGMGGLDHGELASAEVIRMLSYWFDHKLPDALETMGFSDAGFERLVDGQWAGLIRDMNMDLIRRSMAVRMNMGTTLTAMLLVGGRYTVAHVGDTRAYEIDAEAPRQITEDQTFVKREVDAGRMTPEEALVHPRRNVLLQCLGSTKEVVPAFYHGTVRPGSTYLLCSDGFRHVLTEGELQRRLGPAALDEAAWEAERTRPGFAKAELEELEAEEADGVPKGSVTEALKDAAQHVMDRKEADNITAVVLRAQKEGAR